MNSLYKKVLISILLISLLFVAGYFISIQGDTDADELISNYDNDEINNVVFPKDEVISVNVEIDTDDYEDLISNAIDKTYYTADITYNDETLYNVGIRAKGNSSLRDVYKAEGDRFSLNVDMDYYIDQDLYGITEINLNNMFEDPSYMAEYLAYEALESIDAVRARTTFVELSINGEYFGLYLGIEEIDENFISNNYSYDEGNLYKPESTDAVGIGADLVYIDDDIDSYTAFEGEDNETVVDLITAINENKDLDEIFDVDSFLKYLAMSTYMIHLDSYQGGMYHNYYLYDNDGIYEWITWDLNMVFNGFPGGSFTDAEVIDFLIDEPVKGDMSSYPLVEAVLSNDEYVETYHNYLKELSENYLNPDNFEDRVNELYDLIKDYIPNQSSSFYTYQEFEDSLYGDSESEINLIDFINMRTENILLQLSGDIPSTNSGQGNVGSSTGAANVSGVGIGEQQMSNELPPTDIDGSLDNKERAPMNDQAVPEDGNTAVIDETIDEETTDGDSVISVVIGLVLLTGSMFFIKSRIK